MRPSPSVLAALTSTSPPSTQWDAIPRLSLDGARPVYDFSSLTPDSMDVTRVDAVTGVVVSVRRRSFDLDASP